MDYRIGQEVRVTIPLGWVFSQQKCLADWPDVVETSGVIDAILWRHDTTTYVVTLDTPAEAITQWWAVESELQPMAHDCITKQHDGYCSDE